MITRRSQGWLKAKKTGHLNEDIICEELGSGFFTSQSKVESVFGDMTTSKTDIFGEYNFSLKKSLKGQVHMNKVRRWITGYELIYGQIPENVKKVFLILFGGYEFINEILMNKEFIHPNSKIRKTEIKRKTLTIETLEKYDNHSLNEFIFWMDDNISNVAEIVFSRGWVRNSQDWAQILWYRNAIGENKVNQKFDIKDLVTKCKGKKCTKGTKNGGTTIQLPFGHLQYHQEGLQFHHDFKKIFSLFVD